RPCHLSRQPSPAVPPAPLVRRHLVCRPGRAAPARLSDRDRGCTPPVRSKSPERVLERVSWPPLSTKFLRDRDARPASAGPSPAIAAANAHARSWQRLLRFPGDRQVADIFPPGDGLAARIACSGCAITGQAQLLMVARPGSPSSPAESAALSSSY